MMAELALLSPRPAHVPEELLFDFDISNDPLLKPDLHRGLIELSRRTPEIFWTPRYGGHWVVRSHEAIFEVSRDYATFSSDLTKVSDNRMMLPIFLDPPVHQVYRKILLGAFAPKTVNALLPRIRELTGGITRELAGRGRCEFVSEVSEIIPITIFMEMMGVPMELRLPLRKLITAALFAGHPDERDVKFAEMEDMLRGLVEARFARREDDIISRMIDSDIEGRRPTVEEMTSFVVFLTTAGLDTVTNAMGFTTRHLATDQSLQARVRADPELIPDFVEEMLRRYGISSLLRFVTHDTEFRGVRLRKGERMHILLPAGNLDPLVYPEPDRIELGREEPITTFGIGVHRCLGSHLARLELRTLFEDMLRNWPPFTLDPDDPPTESAGIVYSVDHLPLIWAPGQ
jgi:cytochrome P450